MTHPSHSMDSTMNSFYLTNNQPTDQQTVADVAVTTLDDAVSAENYTASIARIRTEQCNDDPFYVVDLGQLVRQHRQWVAGLPRVAPFYAVKCNNDPVLLRLLAKLGCGFDCASKPEIEQVLSLGVTPDRIIYANPCKTASHLRFAAQKGVARMTFDSDSELHKIKRLHPDAKVVLRIAVSDPTAICQLNLKFGAEPVHRAADLLRTAAELGLDVVGISFHVGSGCRDPTAYGEAIGHARRLFDLGAGLGHRMTVLDLGGGYPGFPNLDISFEEIARVINEHLNVHFPASSDASPVEIIAEPGRFYATAAYTLCANVISVKECAGKDISADASCEEEAYMYYLNDGVYGSFNCVLYDHVVPYGYAVNKGANSSEWTRCSIWGPTCDSFDCIMANTRFPRLEAGDWLVFPNMGAYTIAAYSDFNGFEKPDVTYVAGQTEWKTIQLLMATQQNQVPTAAKLLLSPVPPEPTDRTPAHWLTYLYEKLNRMHVGSQPRPSLTDSPSASSLSEVFTMSGGGSDVDTESVYSAGGITLGSNDEDDCRGMVRGFKQFEPS